MLPSLLLAVYFAAFSARAETVVVDLDIVNEQVAPDGFPRGATLAGGTMPGQLIAGQKGDKFQITVHNKLNDPNMLLQTSVHWHGIHMHRSNWADGTVSVTQCPILADSSFKYEFDLSEGTGSGQTGTFWYHSHFLAQYCDGLRGPLVVYDPEDPARYGYDIDDAGTIISLADWFHPYGPSFKPGKPDGSETPNLPPFPDSTLINGKGRDPLHPEASELSVITVERGKKYRMRVISMACETSLIYSIDGHDMKIIEADSIATKPHIVDSFEIFAGQRYSFILMPQVEHPDDSYWMRSRPTRMVKAVGEPGYDGNVNVAILHYVDPGVKVSVGEKVAEPSVPAYINIPDLTNQLKEADLHPFNEEDAPGMPGIGNADINLRYDSVYKGDTGKYEMNGVSFEGLDKLPILLQILNGARTAQELLPKDSITVLPRNKVIEVTLPGTPGPKSGGPHPFHLHGHDFYLVKPAGSEPRFESVLRRDTAITGLADDSMVIRFVTDNPGPWFLHCHLDFHLEMGMGIVFAEDTLNTALDDPPPEAWRELCKDYTNFLSGQAGTSAT